MTDIKILRSFIKFTPSFNKKRYIPIDKNKDLGIYFYRNNEKYDFSVNIVVDRNEHGGGRGYPLFARHEDGSSLIWFGDKLISIHPDNFQDTDDLILIFKHGRNILDENFIELHNKANPEIEIKLSDFNPLFELVGL